MFELRLHLEREIKTSDDVKLVVNGESVDIEKVVVSQKETEEFDEELKQAYLAVKEDRKEVMKDWECVIADGLKE